MGLSNQEGSDTGDSGSNSLDSRSHLSQLLTLLKDKTLQDGKRPGWRKS